MIFEMFSVSTFVLNNFIQSMMGDLFSQPKTGVLALPVIHQITLAKKLNFTKCRQPKVSQ